MHIVSCLMGDIVENQSFKWPYKSTSFHIKHVTHTHFSILCVQCTYFVYYIFSILIYCICNTSYIIIIGILYGRPFNVLFTTHRVKFTVKRVKRLTMLFVWMWENICAHNIQFSLLCLFGKIKTTRNWRWPSK